MEKLVQVQVNLYHEMHFWKFSDFRILPTNLYLYQFFHFCAFYFAKQPVPVPIMVQVVWQNKTCKSEETGTGGHLLASKIATGGTGTG